MEYIVISDDQGVVAAQRRTKSQVLILTEDEAITFVMRTLRLGRIQVFGSLERAPTGATQLWVYLSNAADGVGRTGRNWVPLMIEDRPQ